MKLSEAQAIVDRQAAYKKANPGPFSGLAPDVNGAQLRIAREVLAGEIPEDAPPVTAHPISGAPLSPEEHRSVLAQSFTPLPPAPAAAPAPELSPEPPAGESSDEVKE